MKERKVTKHKTPLSDFNIILKFQTLKSKQLCEVLSYPLAISEIFEVRNLRKPLGHRVYK